MSTEINRVLFIGSKPLGLSCLKTIHSLFPEKLAGVLTIEDANDSRGTYAEFVAFCSENDLPIYTAKNRKHSEELLQQIQPEFCLVVCWYWLISKEILDAAQYGFVGIHNSLLPKYRGSSPLVWSIINGDEEIGYSLFSFTEGMDDGDIWHQYKKKLEIADDIKTILETFEVSVIDVLKDLYPKIIRTEIKPLPQKAEEIIFCAQRNVGDGLIDWNKSAWQIFNFVRAQTNPYPGAFTY